MMEIPRLHCTEIEPVRLVGLLARDAGLATLRGLVAGMPVFEVAAIFTHRRLPRAEGPARGQRPEFENYASMAEKLRVPLYGVDTRMEADVLEGLAACRPFDVLLSVNWRYLVPAAFLDWPGVAAINIHRGRLPDYAGAEPIRRALEAGETAVTLTAHLMTAECDAGPVLVEHVQPIGPRRGPTMECDIERIKQELVPWYPRVAMQAIQRAKLGAAVGV